MFQKIAIAAYKDKQTPADVFIRNRARIIVIKRVINELHELKKHDL
jgi:hypothetical protein